MSMNVVQFLDEVGHTKLRFQYLHECILGARVKNQRQRVTEVRFGTQEITPVDVLNTGRVGIIVWMDRADFERAQEKAHV